MSGLRKKIAVVCRRPPYGSSYPREALDMALAAAAFDQEVSLLFVGDGVWQLVRGQLPTGQKSLEKQLGALPLYDVDKLYVDAEALAARQLHPAELVLPATPLAAPELAALLAAQDVVLGF
jgi:tRNA 2-thiouridine synthesizing protein C